MFFKNFSDTLRENLEMFDGDYAPFIDNGPNLFSLLCDVLDNDICKQSRLEVNAAIAYYVVPNDVIPEEIYGPYGYIDDIFISVYVLKRIADKYGYDFLRGIWKFDGDVELIISECYNTSLEILEDKVYIILSYAGLVE